MAKEEESSRVVYLDALRVFAVFSMMLLHVAGSQWANVPVASFSWQVFNIYDSLARFCVPVFFMISGAFFLDNARPLPWKKLLTKNLFRILTSYLFWSACYAFILQALSYASARTFSLIDFGKDFIFGRYHLWFLFAVAGLYLITPLLRRITADQFFDGIFFALVLCFFSFGQFLKTDSSLCLHDLHAHG
jgi:surface polysaccharide O-acyltransferase-like enzyme